MAFARTSGISAMVLSPDGNLVAATGDVAGKTVLAIIDAPTHKPISRINVPDKTQLEWYKWAGSKRLLISISTIVPYFDDEVKATRLYVYDLAAAKLSEVSRHDMGIEGDDLLFTDPAGEYVLLSIQQTVYDYPSVWRFPLDGTAARKGVLIQPAKNEIWEWYADDSGVVRMGLAFSADRKTKVWYRSAASENFRAIARLTEDSGEDEIWDMARIVTGSDDGYALKADASGHVALRKFNYATRTPGETVYAAPGWDVSDFDVDRTNKPVWATYTDDRDHIAWFDPRLKALQARLERAVAGSDVVITSRARDDSRMLVWVGHEDDPGSYYLYTAATARLEELNITHPGLDPRQLAVPRPVSYVARDKTVIHGYLTLPRGRTARGLPLIVMPHGGPYWVRDKLEYNGDVQFLANRGYAVLQPNFRGSDGYGEAFDKLGEGQIGRGMQDDLDDGMDWAVAQGLADPKRVCMVGSSYGGYAALWAVIRNPERYRCAASFAGVTDWKKQLKYNGKFFSPKSNRKWRARVTGEDGKFDLDQVSPQVQIARLTRPVLLTHGDADTRVTFKQFKQFRDAAAKAGKPIETVVFAGEGHGFDKPEDEAKWLESLDAFLTKYNPAD